MLLLRILGKPLGDEILAEVDTLVAKVNLWAGHQLLNRLLPFAAEGTFRSRRNSAFSSLQTKYPFKQGPKHDQVKTVKPLPTPPG